MKLFAIFRVLRPIFAPTPTGITPRAARTRDPRNGAFDHALSPQDRLAINAAEVRRARRQARNLRAVGL